jgi:ubiquinone/menaquinone biosynthesis C-methylase UbiE
MNDAEFDKFAKNYREIHAANIKISGEDPEYFSTYKMTDFADHLRSVNAPAGGRYLDFGSGIGNSVTPFLHQLPFASLICADVSPESLSVLKKQHGSKVTAALIEESHLPLDSETLDGAFACCVFHHIEPDDRTKALHELKRVLKTGATLMLYEHNPLNPLTVHSVRTCPLDENAELIFPGRLRSLCLECGFRSAHVDYRVFFPAALRRVRFLEHWLKWLPFGAQYAVYATK